MRLPLPFCHSHSSPNNLHSISLPLPFPPIKPTCRRPRWPRMDSTISTVVRHHHRRRDKIIVIMGATGTGKSRLSIDLASTFPSEIINSDKMQVYKGLDITTNKIPTQERRGVPHHLMGEFNPEDGELTPSEFRSLAGLAVSDILSRRKLPLIVGGSNSFIHALLVERFDPELDVFNGSHKVSTGSLRYNCCFLWVDVSLQVLCDYLSKRVDDMLDSGMFNELAEFYDQEEDNSTTQTGLRKAIGVPEFDRYFKKYPPGILGTDPEGDRVRRGAYEEAVREIKENTCQLAKRQIGKIDRLKGAGWDLRRLDATEAFREVMTSDSGESWREIWERQVMEPSVKIVKRFLEE